MLIEFIGCTGSGKSVLSEKVFNLLINKGNKPKLLHIGGNFKYDIYTIPWSINYFIYNIKLIRLVVRMLSKPTITVYNRINLLRNFVKKVGTNQLVRFKYNDRLIILDEGTIHSVHNIFVHDNYSFNDNNILEFVELIPKPDIIVYIKTPEEILIAETIKRGHRRIDKKENIGFFIRNAIKIFESIGSIESICSRLLIVENYHYGAGEIDILAKNIATTISDDFVKSKFI